MREILLPAVAVLIGLGFFYSGFRIKIQKQYDSMNGYYDFKLKYADFKGFAERYGLIELVGGAVLLALGIVSAFRKDTRMALLSAFLGTAAILLALKLNKIFTKKRI